MVLADRFELGPPVTAGGMGTVHMGVDRQSGRTVAIKILRDPGGAVDVERFVREGEILATLDHPSIVRYIARGTTAEARPYLVMEWVEGETLQSRLTSTGLTAQAAVPVRTDDDEKRLAARVLQAEHGLYPLALKIVAEGMARMEAGRTVFNDGGFPEQTAGPMLVAPEFASEAKNIEDMARFTP